MPFRSSAMPRASRLPLAVAASLLMLPSATRAAESADVVKPSGIDQDTHLRFDDIGVAS